MAIYVYVTDNCRENAITHGLQPELERFVARVDKAQSLELFTNFPTPYLVKRKFGGDQGRLIAEHRRIPGAEEHTVVFFLAILIRGSAEYDHGFGINPQDYGRKHLQGLYTEESVFDWLSERLRKPSPDRIVPTECENRFLHAVSGAVTGGEDWTIAESKQWVRAVGRSDVLPHLGSIWESVEHVATAAREASEHAGVQPAGSRWSIHWRSHPAERLLILEDVLPLTAPAPEFSEDSEATRETLLKRCRRSYLDILVADQQQWLEIQRDQEGNLALSPEEQDVIDSTRPRSSDSDTSAFPLFINGRAGSGKSTVLQYLFSDYLMTYLELMESGQLPAQVASGGQSWPTQGSVYFTSNKDLLKRAHTTVTILLRNGAQYWDKADRASLLERHRKDIDSAFCDLRGYLLSLVEPAEQHRFDLRNYVSYPRFHRLWMDKFGQNRRAMKDHGAALSWHIIRTHIKGATEEDYLDPSEYELIDKKQRTVSRASFEIVYKDVWENWYRRKSEGEHLWDDQDLARHLLDKDRLHAIFHAVFCDEAQDSTSVELQAILRLSVFSKRQLAQHQVKRVPFVFAGDPFQTLNPTGFRWDSTKASYYKNFVLSLDPWGDPDSSLNYRELSHNYRSSRNIVGFCNLIQARRAQLFEIKQISAQQLWVDEDNPLPVYWFACEDETFWQEFANQKDLVVVAPCAEGEEAAFVKDDAELNARISVKAETPENVWSTTRAKGLEFDRVVVYKFGSSDGSQHVAQWRRENDSGDVGKRLPAEYFFNQLYVAASRAKRALYIVDSRAAIRDFWGFATTQPLESMLKHAPGGIDAWNTLTHQMIEGSIDNLRVGDYKPAATADLLEQQGMNAEAAYTLRQAAVHYRNANNYAAAERCEAFAAQYDGNFGEAGEAFLSQKRWKEAVRAFWMNGLTGRKELIAAAAQQPEIRQFAEWKIAHGLVAKEATAPQWLDLLDESSRLVKQEFGDWGPEVRKAWGDALTTAVSKIAGFDSETATQVQWADLLDRIENVSKSGVFAVSPTDLGEIAARAGRFRQALELFAKAGANESNLETQPNEFIKAAAEEWEFPKAIGALEKLSHFDRIVMAWDGSDKANLKLSATQTNSVINSLVETGRLDEALTLTTRAGSGSRALQIAEKAERSGEFVTRWKALSCGLLLLAQQREWDRVLQLIQNPALAGHENHSRQQSLVKILAQALAASAAIADERIGPALIRSLSTLKGEIKSEDETRLYGCALETAGQINPTIDFYEEQLGPKFKMRDTADFNNWLRSRLYKWRWKRSLTRSAKRNPQAAKTDQLGIKSEVEKWKLGSIENIPDLPERLSFPSLLEGILKGHPERLDEEPTVKESLPVEPPAPSPIRASAPEIEMLRLFDADFQLNRTKKRLTLTRSGADDRVRLMWNGQPECDADLQVLELDRGRWEVPEWRLEMRIESESFERKVVVRCLDRKMEIVFDG